MQQLNLRMKKEDMVKLTSAEGFEFVIDKKAAMVSQTIRNMLTSGSILHSPPSPAPILFPKEEDDFVFFFF